MDAIFNRPELVLGLAIVAIAAGFAVTVFASRRAVTNAADLAAGTRIPPFAIGITLLAIGTDLPEIVNSIIASLSGHGDINVGDSVGSAATQATLVLGLLPILGGALVVGRRRIATIGGVTVGALLFGAFLMLDGRISRWDAALLLVTWVAGSALAWRNLPSTAEPSLPVVSDNSVRRASIVLGSLVVVMVGAGTALWGLTKVAEVLGAPEYLIAFFVASIGTSLPELSVGLSAIRRRQVDLAVGNALGSSFADATISIGIGPTIAPIAVTTSLVVPGSIAAAVVIAAVVLLLSIRKRHDWATGMALIALYLAFYALWLLV